MKRKPSMFIALLCLSTLGCGGANESYLPKPRPPEPEVAPAARPAAAKPAPIAAAPPIASDASAPPDAPANVPPGPPPGSAANSSPSAPATSPAPQGELSEADRRRRVVGQLTRIGQALEAYRAKKGCYPSRSAFAGRLSWRVALLPYLGHDDLCAMFDKEEPWDHANNRRLLGRIPEVFQAAERSDGKTNLVLVAGPDTAYATAAGLRPEQCPDGLENTILVVEVDDACAVPWTAAEDYEFQRDTAQAALFGKRKDCCYALLGGATGVRRIPANLADDQLLALVTPAGGEAIAVSQLTSLPHPDIDTQLIRQLEQHPLARFASPEVSASPATSPSTGPPDLRQSRLDPAGTTKTGMADQAAGGSLPARLTAKVPAVDQRLPVPDDTALQTAAALVREVYSAEYQAAGKPEQRRALAKKMLSEAAALAAEPAGLFALYRSAREIAAQAGDLDTSFQANRMLTETYQVDSLPAERQIVEQAAAAMHSQQDWKSLSDHALRVGDLALREDDFAGAQRLYSLALSAARQADCRDRLARVYQRQEWWKSTQLAYHRVSRQMHVLVRKPDDAAANAAVGRYLALVKHDWERGLPMLARGDEADLAQLAQRDLRSATTPEEQLRLADGWWDWSEHAFGQLERDGARQRAAQWYRRVLPQLSASLVTARIEKRLAELAPSHDDASFAAMERRDG